MLSDTAIVLDFETTGLDWRCDRVTEVAALRVQGGHVVERFTSLVNCRLRIPAYIAGFTGISQAMIDGAPDSEPVFRQLLEFIADDPVIAHNASFDQAFFDAECLRLGLTHHVPDFLCSVQIARRLFPDMQSHALGCLTSRLGIAFTPGAHRAEVDASVTTHVLLRVCEILRSRCAVPVVTVDLLRRFASAVEAPAAVASAA